MHIADDKKSVELITLALREVFGDEGDKSRRFIDVARIPLICASIINIEKSLLEVQKMMASKFGVQDKKIEHLNKAVDKLHDSVSDLYKVVSQDSGRIKLLETLKEQEKDNALKMAEKENEVYRSDEIRRRDRVLFIVVVVILFILGALGFINQDLIKAVLPIV